MPPAKLTVELVVDIANLGRHSEMVEVSTSQARNYLIPKGLAKEVTAERMKQIDAERKRSADQARMRLLQAFDIQKQLDGQTIEFTLKGKGNKVFGGLNEHDIATRLKSKYGVDFEKKDVKLPNKTHIKTGGSHMVYLHITRDTLAKVFVEVRIEEGK